MRPRIRRPVHRTNNTPPWGRPSRSPAPLVTLRRGRRPRRPDSPHSLFCTRRGRRPRRPDSPHSLSCTRRGRRPRRPDSPHSLFCTRRGRCPHRPVSMLAVGRGNLIPPPRCTGSPAMRRGGVLPRPFCRPLPEAMSLRGRSAPAAIRNTPHPAAEFYSALPYEADTPYPCCVLSVGYPCIKKHPEGCFFLSLFTSADPAPTGNTSRCLRPAPWRPYPG